jgi:hypothetical protein
VTAAVGGLALVAAASIGAVLYLKTGRPVHASAAPWFARWWPHAGPGTAAAVVVAATVTWFGPAWAGRLPWRRLLAIGYLAAVAWTLSLALVDGWQRGLAGRLTTPPEYLTEVGGVTDIRAMLAHFTSRIVDGQPHSWTTHVSGHPPGALLVFVWLERIGLGGGAAAGLLCIAAGAAAAVAVPVAVRTLGNEQAARACLPFAVLLPGAVWLGVSADALFAGVTAAGLAALAVGLRRGRPAWTLLSGGLLGFAAYLSYGLLLIGLLALTIVVIARPRLVQLIPAALGASAVVLAFTVYGFNWLDGYHAVKIRYYQGIASHRPYSYWVWGDLAAMVGSIGLAGVAIARRAIAALWSGRTPAVWLPIAALVAVGVADLSGLSKAEVERIWLPFAVWLPAGASLLPAADHRRWLAVQAVSALLLNHLLLTEW